MNESMPTVNSPDFREASIRALAFLRDMTGMDLWMVTRVDGEDWIVLESEDHGYGIKRGDLFTWSDSFCSRMVNGLGPRVAAVASDVPAYREAPIGRAVPIGAYVGIPLQGKDGELFGTLCSIDPQEKGSALKELQPTFELIADLLSGILAAELKVEAAERAARLASLDATHDELTGIGGRRGWNLAISAEEDRCVRHGHPAAVVFIDLDELKRVNDREGHEAGDELLRVTAATIKGTLRGHDFAARIGGDEFAVLAPECNPAQAKALSERLRVALGQAGIKASVGYASRRTSAGLEEAVREADQGMYEDKLARRKMGVAA